MRRAMEKAVVKVNDVEQKPAGTVGEVNDRTESTVANTAAAAALATGPSIAGTTEPDGNNHVAGMLAAVAALLAIGAAGVVIWQRRKSDEE